MTTLSDIVSHVFSDHPKSPVMVVMGGYRKEQADFANRVVGTIMGSEEEHEKALLHTSQVPTGTGKTVAYLVPHIANIALGSDTRVIVSTHTIELRDQIIKEDFDRALKMVNLALKFFGEDEKDISCGEKKSFRQYPSYVTAHRLAKDAKDGSLEREYYNWVVNSYADAALMGTPPTISEWMSNNERGENWPEDLGLLLVETSTVEDFLSIPDIDADIANNVMDTIAFIREEQSSVNDTDVVVCTHAMFVINNFLYGGSTALNTSKQNSDHKPVLCIIDECDELMKVSEDYSKMETDISRLKEIVDSIKDPSIDRLKNNSLYKTCNALVKFIKGLHTSFKFKRDYTDVQLKELDTLIREFNEAVKSNKYKIECLVDCGILHVGQYEYIKQCLDAMSNISLMYARAGTSDTDIVLYERGEATVFSSINGKNTKNESIKLGIDVKYGSIASMAWRNYNCHSYKSIHMISGTIDPKGGADFSDFNTRVGIGKYDNYDGIQYVVSTNTGVINQFVLADSKNAVPTDYKNREKYAQYVADAIDHALSDGKKTLVLFPSGDLKNRVYSRLSKYHNDITLKKTGVRPKAYFDDHINTGKKHWFGHEWSGTNFVHDKETMFERIIIAQFPIPPHTVPEKIKRNESDGFRKLRQGIGRVFRNTKDNPDVWILDPRIGMYVGILYTSLKTNSTHRKYDVTGTIERKLIDASVKNKKVMSVGVDGKLKQP